VRVGADNCVTLGRICGVQGVRGWVKVLSFTVPRSNVASYRQWLVADETGKELIAYEVEAVRANERRVTVKLAGIDDRDQAALLIGRDIRVRRTQLPACKEGEYYWADLEGLDVVNARGELLGEVSHLIETGAHDVLVLAGDEQHMIPFVAPEIVTRVDLASGVIVVDWENSFWD
jgi:16S rRNA processing protein RimM